MMEFGKLVYLDLRSAWTNEASDFTPWLADNLQVLGDVLGLELELKEREASVGNFSCDLHAVDLASGRVVIVENQLEPTDHTHLGQLLTYAAGLDAAVVVWVAREIRDEHRAALDWLNRKTGADIDFFAVVPRVFQIDNSKPTYELQLVVSPNEWGKNITIDERASDPNGKGERYKIFFQRLIDSAREVGFKGLKQARRKSWMRFSTVRGDIGLYVSFSRTSQLKIEVYFESTVRDENKARFDALYKDAEQIDNFLNRKLSWERLDDRIGSRIALYHDGSIDSPPEELEVLCTWALGEMKVLRERLLPAVLKVIEG